MFSPSRPERVAIVHEWLVNHAGMMVPGEEAEWRAGMRALTAIPQVAVKRATCWHSA